MRLASSRFRRLIRSARPRDLGLVGAKLAERRRLARQVVVEEPHALGLRELGRPEGADVDGAVEMERADEVPGDSLVDGDVAVLLGPDEVRAGEGEEPARCGE